MAKRKRIKKLTWGKLWTKLKKLGWRFERPKGLATENRYFTPAGWEKRPHATHLVDYYEGPDEVWKHLPEDGADGASEPPPSTIQTNRRGYCKAIPYKSAKRPKNMARGSYRIAQSKDEPSMIAVSWMDNRPVHFIATGCSTEPATLSRREGSAVVDVPAPRLVKEYQDGMGGADVHDQLRLQRYSIQGAMKMRKYYHTIFLGLVDMALINAFIIFRRVQGDRTTGPAQPTHAHFMRVMQMSLLAVGASDFEGDLSVRALTDTPVPPSPTPRYRLSTSHSTKQVEVYRTTRGKNGKESRKRRQYACKVRQHDPTAVTNSATCSQIWHELWGGGANIPPGLKSIRLRAPVDQGAQASDGDDDVSSVSSGARSGSDGGSPAEGIVEPAVI
ncbi:hypothetical protein F442_23038 [Phytophthora nicotianae P10297]|uniref:PiggyBac transposable element-derived protein domain-containing protein n=1 Tax=Phytophthora nicotianae P10297 TaxID=1317064 RepID=W2XXV8_PHYNI|nr:hypothetical protein F442_23038 [Phytophthora nicotianae P10297]